MMFHKQALLDACETALATDAANEKARAEIVKKYDAKHRAQWNDREQSKWRTYRDSITAALKTNQPINDSMLAKKPYGTSREIEYPLRNERDNALREVPRIDVVEIKALRSALNALASDEVSDGQLRNVGFTGSSVAKLLRAAQVEIVSS